MVTSVLSVNRKGNNSQPKPRKPSHNNGILEILACLQKTCRMKLSVMYRNKTSIQYLDKNPSELELKKCHYPFKNCTHSDINLTNHRGN